MICCNRIATSLRTPARRAVPHAASQEAPRPRLDSTGVQECLDNSEGGTSPAPSTAAYTTVIKFFLLECSGIPPVRSYPL